MRIKYEDGNPFGKEKAKVKYEDGNPFNKEKAKCEI